MDILHLIEAERETLYNLVAHPEERDFDILLKIHKEIETMVSFSLPKKGDKQDG